MMVLALGSVASSRCDSDCQGDECDYKEYRESGEEAAQDDYERGRMDDLPDRYRYGDGY